MAYKEKECEQCHQKHTKRGRFCSRTCSDEANRGRRWTAEQKAAVSDGLSKWHRESDTAAVAVYKWSQQGLNPTPDPIAPPVRAPIADNQFIAGGDLWTECD
jgi:hypothetical protein